MKTLCLAVVLAVCVSAAAARTAGGAVLAPVPSAALESFLEAGAHTDAEIDAMAQAEVAAVLGDADEAEHEGEHEVEAEAEAEAEHEVEADAEADAEMPRDTKAEEARQKRLARAKARAAAAARPPVPPPSALSAAAGGDSDIIRMVYDELNRLGAMSAPSAAAAAAAPASTLGVTDPRIRTLEHRLTSYENAAAEKSFKAKSGAINALATRLEGLDKTLAALKKSQEEQQALSARLLKATKAAEAKQDAGANAVDYSVGYVKATLPADFDAKVKAILGSVKTEARKIYERYCKRAGIKPKLDTPASYPTEKAGAAAPAAAAADTDAPAAAAPSESAAAAGGASMAPLPASANPAVAEAAAVRRAKKAVVQGRPEKIMMKPIINGKEPTPEGMRLSKALNDISLALPITPAYALSAKEKALQDTLGEDAVNPKWKTKRI